MQKDKFGPELVVEVYNPEIGLEGYLVIDNTCRGVGKGGIRMSDHTNRSEVMRLARAMSLKNALADLPFGGAKGGIVWTKDRYEDKKQLFSAFITAIQPYLGSRYVAAPDINTGETEMGWLLDVTQDPSTTTGKPVERGGLAGKSMATGFGVAVSAETAIEHLGRKLSGAKVAIDGYGTVGRHAFTELQAQGAVAVAVSDSKSGVYLEEGFDSGELDRLKDSRDHKLAEYPGAKSISHDELRTLDVDILILSSISDVIDEDNYSEVKASVIAQGANLPIAIDIEEKLHQEGVTIIPDIIANAGGVIASWLEHDHPDTGEEEICAVIRSKITANTKAVLESSAAESTYPRAIALRIAEERLARQVPASSTG